ncbi:MAG: glycosyltransferase family 4 protein, partial [Luteimonas sp.]
GSLGWRKGTDLFVQIARRIAMDEGRDNMRFLWVGGNRGDREASEFRHDGDLLGLGTHCRLIHASGDVSDHYCAMDVFALTSREDPYPLVMLEAGAHGLPVVAFDGSGGAVEFTRAGTGACVPYLDVDAFARELMRLRDSPMAVQALGATARRQVAEAHDIEVQGPKLLALMDECLVSRGISVRGDAAGRKLLGHRSDTRIALDRT